MEGDVSFSLSLFSLSLWTMGRVFFNATWSAVVLDVALMVLLLLLLHVVLLLQGSYLKKKAHFSYSSFSSSSSSSSSDEEEDEEENNQSFSNFSNPSTRTRLPPASRISLARSSLLEPGFSPIKSMSVDLASEEETEPPRRSMSRWISERVFEDVGNVPVMQTFRLKSLLVAFVEEEEVDEASPPTGRILTPLSKILCTSLALFGSLQKLAMLFATISPTPSTASREILILFLSSLSSSSSMLLPVS